MKTLDRFSGANLSLITILGPVVALLVLAYVAYAAYPLVAGPRLNASIEQQENGHFLIKGEVKRVAVVSINESPVALTDQGTFAVERAFPPGYTVIIVRAQDRFGRVREQTLTLVNSHYIQYGSEENNIEESSSTESVEDSGDASGQTRID
jgi:hypothetical protein